VAESGCYNKVHILNGLLKAAKSDKGIVVVQLDNAKAFDTIPHQALKSALERMGIPANVRDYTAKSYRELTTRIEYIGLTKDVTLKTVVKQGTLCPHDGLSRRSLGPFPGAILPGQV
jgi:hypothetical protein